MRRNRRLSNDGETGLCLWHRQAQGPINVKPLEVVLAGEGAAALLPGQSNRGERSPRWLIAYAGVLMLMQLPCLGCSVAAADWPAVSMMMSRPGRCVRDVHFNGRQGAAREGGLRHLCLRAGLGQARRIRYVGERSAMSCCGALVRPMADGSVGAASCEVVSLLTTCLPLTAGNVVKAMRDSAVLARSFLQVRPVHSRLGQPAAQVLRSKRT